MAWLIDKLNGKKTYLMAAVYGLDAMGSQLGWWAADSARAIIEQVLTIITLRAGVTKSGPV